MFKLVDDACHRYCVEVLRTLSVDIDELGLFTRLVFFRVFVEHSKDADLSLEILIKTLRDQIAKAVREPKKDT